MTRTLPAGRTRAVRRSPAPARARTGALRVLLAVLVVALLAGCSGLEGTGDKGYITAEGAVRQLPPTERAEPVELSGTSLQGEQLALEQFRGTPVVVVVWGSWCAPCRAEAPELAELARELAGEVQFLGINIRDASEANALGFVRSFDIPYPSIYSPSGEALLAFDGTLTPNTIPSTVVLDSRGRVAASIIGKLPSQLTLKQLVEQVSARG